MKHPLILLSDTYDIGDGYMGIARENIFLSAATMTIRFSKAHHVRREPDEVRQQVEDRTDRKKRQAGLTLMTLVSLKFLLSRLLLLPIASRRQPQQR